MHRAVNSMELQLLFVHLKFLNYSTELMTRHLESNTESQAYISLIKDRLCGVYECNFQIRQINIHCYVTPTLATFSDIISLFLNTNCPSNFLHPPPDCCFQYIVLLIILHYFTRFLNSAIRSLMLLVRSCILNLLK